MEPITFAEKWVAGEKQVTIIGIKLIETLIIHEEKQRKSLDREVGDFFAFNFSKNY